MKKCGEKSANFWKVGQTVVGWKFISSDADSAAAPHWQVFSSFGPCLGILAPFFTQKSYLTEFGNTNKNLFSQIYFNVKTNT